MSSLVCVTWPVPIHRIMRKVFKAQTKSNEPFEKWAEANFPRGLPLSKHAKIALLLVYFIFGCKNMKCSALFRMHIHFPNSLLCLWKEIPLIFFTLHIHVVLQSLKIVMTFFGRFLLNKIICVEEVTLATADSHCSTEHVSFKSSWVS